MQQAVIRVFDAFDLAQRAHDALLAEGFPAADIALKVVNDEAGPVESNFTVGNLPVESDRHTYERNYVSRGTGAQCIVTVTTDDAILFARADALLDRFGARPLNTPGAS